MITQIKRVSFLIKISGFQNYFQKTFFFFFHSPQNLRHFNYCAEDHKALFPFAASFPQKNATKQMTDWVYKQHPSIMSLAPQTLLQLGTIIQCLHSGLSTVSAGWRVMELNWQPCIVWGHWVTSLLFPSLFLEKLLHSSDRWDLLVF